MKVLQLCLLCFLFGSPVTSGLSLEDVTDAELTKLVMQEQYVVVLFTNDNEKSREMEVELATVREDLVDSINAWVVKAIKSKWRSRYSPGDPEEPLVVFFRKQWPVLYDGPANEEVLLETLLAYKDRCTQDLTDTSFEHLTQAATGATTGDWLIEFFKDECEDCEHIRARMETVACKHKGRINVARVNKGTTGAVTGRRFEIGAVPALLFFRLGRMYRYTVEKYDVDSISAFITGWYKNVLAESIPLPKSPFDDLIQMCVDYLREYPLLFAVLIGLPVLLFISFIYLTASTPDKPRTKKKKKKTEKSDKSEKSEKDKDK